MTRPRILFAGLILAWCSAAFALDPTLDISQYGHFAWKYRDGFAKGAIQDIAQTPDGYLWLGTSFGLLRFDGVKAVPWQPPPDPSGKDPSGPDPSGPDPSSKDQRLPSSDIVSLLAARDGALWIGTRNGLASWKNGKLTQYAELAGFQVGALLEDREGSIWVGAYGLPDGKFCEIRNGAVQCHPEMGGLGNGVFSLHEDAGGNLWVGLDKGVWRWKPGPPQFYALPNQIDGVQGMADAEEGGVLISTAGAVLRLVDGKSQIAYPFPPALRQVRGYQMLRDRDGGLWVSTRGGGVVHVHQGRIDSLSRSDGLTGDRAAGLFEDREGNVWVSTTDGGLDRFRELPVVSYSANQGLTAPPSSVVLAARDGSVWIGTVDGLNRLNRGQATVYRGHHAPPSAGTREIVVAGLPAQELGSLFEDSRGRIWISSEAGVGYLENDRYVSTPAPGGTIDAITEDAAGNIWIGHADLGLVRLSPSNEIQQMPWETFGRKDPARPLLDPVQGGVWLGFRNGGVEYFRDGQVRASYSGKDGLAEGRVNDLRLDKGGALWVSADGGLSRVKDGHASTLTGKNGLSCDAVQWMLEDDDRSVWLGMPCGLTRVAKSDLTAWISDPKHVLNLRVFDLSDGVRMQAGVGAYGPRAAKAVDGKLWFYTQTSISVVDPRHLAFNKLPPPVQIEQIKADGKLYDPSTSLRLPARVRDVWIDYTALSLGAPEKTHFRYKLEGQDPDWKEVVNDREAQYTNLPPRNYRFRVIASNNDGVWNETGAALDFSIAPAYYQTAWFQASCGFALLALLWGLYRYRLYQIAREFNVRLDERVGERTRIARDLHDTLLQSFQGLMLRLQVVDDMLPQGKAKIELEKTLDRADQAIAEGRTAVYDLRSSATTTNDLAQAVRDVGNELATPAAATFRLTVEGPSRDLHPIIRDEIYRIAREALRNAFGHARAHHIEAELIYADRQFQLRIRDDGQGIASEILEEGRSGHYGLPGMRERARHIGAKLTIWSGAGTGTEIELSIEGSIAYGGTLAGGRSRLRLFRKKVG